MIEMSDMIQDDIGVGVDIEDISRFEDLDHNMHKGFFERVYSENEVEYCYSKGYPAQHLAVRFACKEAVFKALSSFGIEGISYCDLEIISTDNGCPKIHIKRLGGDYQVDISMSHCKDKAIAFAIAKKIGEIES